MTPDERLQRTFADVLDVIDMQLLSPLCPEVILPRDNAQLLAALLTDMLHTQPQRKTHEHQ